MFGQLRDVPHRQGQDSYLECGDTSRSTTAEFPGFLGFFSGVAATQIRPGPETADRTSPGDREVMAVKPVVSGVRHADGQSSSRRKWRNRFLAGKMWSVIDSPDSAQTGQKGRKEQSGAP